MQKMTKKKLAQMNREKQMQYAKQQNSIQYLSQVSERVVAAASELELYQEMVGEVRANDGLHLSPEHQVITRDQPSPGRVAAMLKKKEKDERAMRESQATEPKAWEEITEGTPQPKAEPATGRKKPKKLPLDIEQLQLKEFTKSASFKSDAKMAAHNLWPDHQQIDITNYQLSQLVSSESKNKEAVFQRIQNQMISRERSSRKNQDLDIKSSHKGGVKNERQNVAFTDQQSSQSNLYNKTQNSQHGILKNEARSRQENSKVQLYNTNVAFDNRKKDELRTGDANGAAGLAKSQRGSSQQPFSSSRNESGPQVGFNTENKNKQKARSRKSTDFEDIDRFNTVKVNKRRTQDSGREGDESCTTGPQNSHWAGLTGLPGMGVPVGGPGYKPGDNVLQDSEINAAMERKGIAMGQIAPRYKGKYAFRNVNQSMMVDRQKHIEKTMLDMVFKYTRKVEERENELQTIDHPGSTDLFNKQDQKVLNMKRKLNQSVDFAEIKQREKERSKRQYEDAPIYKDISELMTFKNDIFVKEMNMIVDTRNSPIETASLPIKEEEKSKTNKPEEPQEDPYATAIASVDLFAGPSQDYTHQKTMAVMARGKSSSNVKVDAEKEEVSMHSEGPHTKQGESDELSQSFFSDHEGQAQKGKNVGFEKDENYADEVFDNPEDEFDDESVDLDDDLVNLDDVQLKSKVKQVLEKEEEPFRHSIRNRPKLQRKQTAVEKLDGELNSLQKKDQMADNREQMRQTEKVFSMIHEYCKESLSVGYNLLDKQIEELLNPNVTVSPLLKYFDLLAKDTNFRLPCKSLLEFDQKYYRKFIDRLREAQKTELQWSKNAIISESKKTVEVAFNQARKLLQTEVKSILYDFDQLKAKLNKQEDENLKLKKVIELQQLKIVEQSTLLNQTMSKLFEEDEQLYLLNGGPGGAFDKFIYGDVIQNIDLYHDHLRIQCEEQARSIKVSMEQKIEEELNDLREAGGQAAPAGMKMGRLKTVVHRVQGGLASPTPATANEIMSLNLLSLNNIKDFVPDKEAIVKKLEPFLKGPFELFSGYVKISIKDIESILNQELYKYQRAEIKKLERKNDFQQAENFANAVMMNELRKTNDRLQAENDVFNDKLNEMKKNFTIETRKINEAAEETMEAAQEKCELETKRIKEFMTLEVKVCTAIKDKMLSENKWMAEKLRKFATIIRIPRLHFDYIEKYGINTFVDFCEDIVRRERAVLKKDAANKKRIDLRQAYSIKNMNLNYGPADKRFKAHLKDIKLNEGEFKLSLPVNINQQTSKMTARDEESQQILKQLEEINWIKNESVLDLTVLISKNMDRQPELLAMLQPDLKYDLMYNPSVLKTIEQLERADPINQRVKDVKDFIAKIKSQTFGHFSEQQLQNADREQLLRFNRNLSSSVLFENPDRLQLNQQQLMAQTNTALKRSASVEMAEQDETVIIQVHSNNSKSKKLLESVPQTQRSTVSQVGIPTLLMTSNNSKLDMKLVNIRNEMKDIVSGLDNARTSTKETLHTSHNHVTSQSVIAGQNHPGFNNTSSQAFSSNRIIGLKQLSKIQKDKQRSPLSKALLNNQSGSRLSLGLAGGPMRQIIVTSQAAQAEDVATQNWASGVDIHKGSTLIIEPGENH